MRTRVDCHLCGKTKTASGILCYFDSIHQKCGPSDSHWKDRLHKKSKTQHIFGYNTVSRTNLSHLVVEWHLSYSYRINWQDFEMLLEKPWLDIKQIVVSKKNAAEKLLTDIWTPANNKGLDFLEVFVSFLLVGWERSPQKMFKVCRHGLRYQKPDFLSPVFWRTGCPVQPKIETVSKRQPYGKIFLSGTFRSRRPSVHFSRIGQDGVCRITPYIMSKGHFPKNILCLRWVM